MEDLKVGRLQADEIVVGGDQKRVVINGDGIYVKLSDTVYACIENKAGVASIGLHDEQNHCNDKKLHQVSLYIRDGKLSFQVADEKQLLVGDLHPNLLSWAVCDYDDGKKVWLDHIVFDKQAKR